MHIIPCVYCYYQIICYACAIPFISRSKLITVRPRVPYLFWILGPNWGHTIYTVFDKLAQSYDNFTSNSNGNGQTWILFNSLFNSMLSQINLVNSLTYDSTHVHLLSLSLSFCNLDSKLANSRSIWAISFLPI